MATWGGVQEHEPKPSVAYTINTNSYPINVANLTRASVYLFMKTNFEILSCSSTVSVKFKELNK